MLTINLGKFALKYPKKILILHSVCLYDIYKETNQ